MSARAARPWTAVLTVTCPRDEVARWLASALAPEAAREVPRAGARVAPPAGRTVTLEIDAADAGAMRAALNTYLGWVELTATTLAAAGTAGRS